MYDRYTAMSIYWGISGLLTVLIYCGILFMIFRSRCRQYNVSKDIHACNLSPTVSRYIYLSGRVWGDWKLMYTALINMAVMGAITINEDNGTFEIRNAEKSDLAGLSDEENDLFQRLFAGNKYVMKLKPYEQHNVLWPALINIPTDLSNRYTKCFSWYTSLPYLSIPMALATIYLMIANGSNRNYSDLIAIIPISIVVIAMVGGIKWLFHGIREKIRYRSRYYTWSSLLLVGILILIPISIGIALFISDIASSKYWIYAFVIALLYNTCRYCMRIPIPNFKNIGCYCTIYAYKRYMTSNAFRNTIKDMSLEEATEKYYKYLPYAIAFDIEKEWAKIIMERIKGTFVIPSWYSGNTYEIMGPMDFIYILNNFFFRAFVSTGQTESSAP